MKQFQQGAGLTADGVVGPLTWAALPDGGPMPTLRSGSTGAIVTSLQNLLTNGAPGQWITTPQGIDGSFGPHTKASVEAFQTWGGVTADGGVGDRPGRFPCTRRAPRWKRRSASASSSAERSLDPVRRPE